MKPSPTTTTTSTLLSGYSSCKAPQCTHLCALRTAYMSQRPIQAMLHLCRHAGVMETPQTQQRFIHEVLYCFPVCCYPPNIRYTRRVLKMLFIDAELQNYELSDLFMEALDDHMMREKGRCHRRYPHHHHNLWVDDKEEFNNNAAAAAAAAAAAGVTTTTKKKLTFVDNHHYSMSMTPYYVSFLIPEKVLFGTSNLLPNYDVFLDNNRNHSSIETVVVAAPATTPSSATTTAAAIIDNRECGICEPSARDGGGSICVTPRPENTLIFGLQGHRNEVGLRTWNGGLYISEYIMTYFHEIITQQNGGWKNQKNCFFSRRRTSPGTTKEDVRMTILELGSGVGLATVLLARNCHGKIISTDGLPSVLYNLQNNIRINRHHLRCQVSCELLDWEKPSVWLPKLTEKADDDSTNRRPTITAESTSYCSTTSWADVDVVMGSDLVYDEALSVALVDTLRILLEHARVDSQHQCCCHPPLGGGGNQKPSCQRGPDVVMENTQDATTPNNTSTTNHFVVAAAAANSSSPLRSVRQWCIQQNRRFCILCSAIRDEQAYQRFCNNLGEANLCFAADRRKVLKWFEYDRKDIEVLLVWSQSAE